MTESEKIPGRRISEEALRSIASEISAGKTLVPESWPNQSRVAVLLSFDVHTQTTTSRFARLVKKFVRHFDRVARPEYGLTRPCYTNYSGSTRLRVIADQYRNRPTILRLPKMNTASRRPDRPQNQNESSVPSRYRTRLSANAAKKSIELQ